MKMHFTHTIIQDLCRTRTYVVEFLCIHKRGWSSNVQVGPRATSVDLVNIEKLEEDEGVEQRSVDTQIVQKDIKDEVVFEVGMQPSIEM
jgi:hypothetical protein